jgi:hypothetical protein
VQLREELGLARAEASGVAAALEAERQTVEQLREEMRAAEEEARQAREAHEQERAQAEQTAAETQAELAQIRGELRLAQDEAASALASVSAERQRVELLEGELTAVHEGPREVPGSASKGWDGTSQRALSAALAGITDWRTALQQAARTLGEKGGWDAVVAWCPEERRGSMKCAATWTAGAVDLDTFEARAWQSPRDVSVGEFGRARSRPAPTCLLDLESAEDALLRAAASAGIRRALLVPIRSGVDTIAMLELLSCAASPPDSELMLSLEAIALQLGTVSQLLTLAATPHWTFGRV